MTPAVRVERLGKAYRIGGPPERYRSLRDAVAQAARAPFERIGSVLRGRSSVVSDRTFLALDDVSFEVQPGEVVGIIGRNGAGKSTLLKILSRITEPTSGYADLFGRVGSLLEVGTGFHPELTGRENIFLNGAILGMPRREIARKFDEIVAFSEIEPFIDTMVKHYSSGMYMRLAFAVAAHLEPEILLIDEVLAVGDLAFQKKCLGKMEDVSRLGRTVLFVSHNMSAVTRLCSRAVLLDQGKVAAAGPTPAVVAEYVFKGHGTRAERQWPDTSRAPAADGIRLLAVRAHDAAGVVQESFDIRQPIAITVEYDVARPGLRFTPCFDVINDAGVVLFLSQERPDWQEIVRAEGRHAATCWLPGNFLAEGTFSVDVAFWGVTTPPRGVIEENGAISIAVHDPLEGGSVRGRSTNAYPGVLRPMLKWEEASA
ncbi:MAG: ATP-binding cassette domain-containing protein [Acidobacteria bacterium]|nr:ATP-binding cassette domain-containing protein [Acidobacteriota bacterium]